MRSIARPFLAALLAVAASVPALGWAQEGAARVRVRPSTSQRSSRRPRRRPARPRATACAKPTDGGTRCWTRATSSSSRDGWSIDLRVRNQRGQVTNGSCFVETRTGDVNLYGFGWGYDDEGDDRMQFNCASVEMKYRECQLPVNGRAVLVQAAVRRALRRRPELGPARRSRLGRPWLPRQVRSHPRRLGRRQRRRCERAGLQLGRRSLP